MDDAADTTADQTVPCPYCREEIRPDAVRCRHCHAAVAARRPGHGGTCPWCREEIHPEAIRCKHCHADLAAARRAQGAREGCGCGCGDIRRGSAVGRQAAGSGRKVLPRMAGGAGRAAVRSDTPADRGCNDYEIDDDGTWCFLESSAHYCIYELCDPAVPPNPYVVFE